MSAGELIELLAGPCASGTGRSVLRNVGAGSDGWIVLPTSRLPVNLTVGDVTSKCQNTVDRRAG